MCLRGVPSIGEVEAGWGVIGLRLLFPPASGTPGTVYRVCGRRLPGPWPHLASGMVRWKVGCPEKLWVREPGTVRGGGGGVVANLIPWIELRWGGCSFLLLSLSCLLVAVGHTGSEVEGGEGCRVGQEDRSSSAKERGPHPALPGALAPPWETPPPLLPAVSFPHLSLPSNLFMAPHHSR